MTSLDEQQKAERQNARLSGGKDQEIIDWISMSSVPWNARFAPKLMKIILGGTQALKRMKPVFSRSTEWYLRVFWATTQQQSHFCSDVPIQIWRGTGWVCRAALRGKRHWGLFSLWQENEKGFILRRQRQLGLVLISDKGFEPFQTAHADQQRKNHPQLPTFWTSANTKRTCS